jgi:dTDP-4-amino-4,6-dideoxygalactose transaminase
MTDPIPFVNLERQFEAIRPQVMAAIETVLSSRAFIQGPFVAAFEKEFGAMLGVRHAIGCSNGTSALSLAMEALGIGRGDEVITTSHTFIATAGAIRHVGATPVFVDIDPGSYTIDPAAVAAAVTPRTKAIVCVHLYGTPCDLDALKAVAERHRLFLIEDSAQAHLARYKGVPVGGIGDAGTFSFFPGKNLGAFGDAGLAVIRDDAAATRVRQLRDHGRLSKYEHSIIGYNHRMDGLQAAILSVELPHLAGWTRRRQEAAARYAARLEPAGFPLPAPPAGAEPVHHLLVVQAGNRDEVLKHLEANGIGCGVHYPVPLHLQPALADLGYRPGALPVTERVAGRILSLPICGSIRDDEVDRACDAFLAVARP